MTLHATARRILAIDVGSKTLGLAVSDETGTIAQPLRTLARQRQGYRRDVASIMQVVNELGIARVVVGLPLTMNGERGVQAQRAEEFAARLRACLNIPVDVHDERLSTFEAEEALKEARIPRERWKDHVDAIAAALILRDYLASAGVRKP